MSDRRHKKLSTLLKLNFGIFAVSFIGFCLIPKGPFQLVPAAGVSWVVISSLESLRIILKEKPKT